MTEAERTAELRAARDEVRRAAGVVLDRAEAILADPGALSAHPAALAIVQACAFEDLVGQRLSKLLGETPSGDPLLNGPAAGGGLSQADIDALLR